MPGTKPGACEGYVLQGLDDRLERQRQLQRRIARTRWTRWRHTPYPPRRGAVRTGRLALALTTVALEPPQAAGTRPKRGGHGLARAERRYKWPQRALGSSGFANTDLDLQLKKHGIHELIVIGLIAHTCVEATVRYAAELGHEITMIKDATADYLGPETHAAFEVNLPHYASAIVTTKEVIEAISFLDC